MSTFTTGSDRLTSEHEEANYNSWCSYFHVKFGNNLSLFDILITCNLGEFGILKYNLTLQSI